MQIHISNCLWVRKGDRSRKGNKVYLTLQYSFSLKKNLKQIHQNVNVLILGEGHVVFIVFSLAFSISEILPRFIFF